MSDEPRVAPRRPEDHIDPVTIAAWLDEPDDLSAEERATIAEHLAGCVECQLVADDLRALVTALAALPDAELPRSFAIPARHARPAPAAVREPAPIRAANRWYDRQMAALRWATAAAAILFVFVLGLDLITTRLDRPTADDEAAVMSMEQSTSAGAQPAAEATADTMAAKEAAEPTATPAAAGQAAATAAPTEAAAAAAAEASPATAEDATEPTVPPTDTVRAAGEPTPAADRESTETRSVSRREERLRLIEFGLAAIFVWLLGLMIALPRLRRWRGNRS